MKIRHSVTPALAYLVLKKWFLSIRQFQRALGLGVADRQFRPLPILLPIVISYVHALIGAVGYLWLRDKNWLTTVNILALSIITGLMSITFVTVVGGIAAALSGEKMRALVLLDQARIIADAAGLSLAAGVCWRLLAGNPRRYGQKIVGAA